MIVSGAASQKIGFWGAAPVVQPSGAGQAAVTLGNTDNEIGGLTIGASYSQPEVHALRDKCEELADDVRALSTLLHALRTALVAIGDRGELSRGASPELRCGNRIRAVRSSLNVAALTRMLTVAKWRALWLRPP